MLSRILGRILREACVAGGLTIERDDATCTFIAASSRAQKMQVRAWYEIPEDLMKKARAAAQVDSIHADDVVEALVANVELNRELDSRRWDRKS